MPVKDHRLVCQSNQGVGKEGTERARPISNQQQRTQRSETHDHCQLKVLEEQRTHPAQIARAAFRHNPRGAQCEKVTCFGPPREHFVHRQQHLVRLHFWPEVTKVLDRTRCLGSPRSKHAFPICP
jgi:hypothetical protein